MIELKRNTEEIEAVVGAFIYPAIISLDSEKPSWSNISYEKKYREINESDNSRNYCITENGESVGYCIMKFVDFENRNALLSTCWISSGDKQKQIGNAMKELIGIIFNHFDIQKLYGILDEDSVFMKTIWDIGFVREGVLRENIYKNADYIDQYVFSYINKEGSEQ